MKHGHNVRIIETMRYSNKNIKYLYFFIRLIVVNTIIGNCLKLLLEYYLP